MNQTYSNRRVKSFTCYQLPLQIQELEQDKRDLERQVNELKAKCEQIEKRAAEQRQVEEKKHAEEIQFLKKTNQQLKVQPLLTRYFRNLKKKSVLTVHSILHELPPIISVVNISVVNHAKLQ